jgi:hypothetical protein
MGDSESSKRPCAGAKMSTAQFGLVDGGAAALFVRGYLVAEQDEGRDDEEFIGRGIHFLVRLVVVTAIGCAGA